jgi:hypothetical protein
VAVIVKIKHRPAATRKQKRRRFGGWIIELTTGGMSSKIGHSEKLIAQGVSKSASKTQALTGLTKWTGRKTEAVFMATNGNSEKAGGLKIILALMIVLVASAVGWCMYAWPKITEKPSSIRVGVGLYLGQNSDTHQFEIRKIFPHSPADKAGLVPGLIVNKVGGVTPNSLKDLNTLLIGPEQSKVIVEVIDPNGATNEVEITREKFVNKSAALN